MALTPALVMGGAQLLGAVGAGISGANQTAEQRRLAEAQLRQRRAEMMQAGQANLQGIRMGRRQQDAAGLDERIKRLAAIAAQQRRNTGGGQIDMGAQGPQALTPRETTAGQRAALMGQQPQMQVGGNQVGNQAMFRHPQAAAQGAALQGPQMTPQQPGTQYSITPATPEARQAFMGNAPNMAQVTPGNAPMVGGPFQNSAVRPVPVASNPPTNQIPPRAQQMQQKAMTRFGRRPLRLRAPGAAGVAGAPFGGGAGADMPINLTRNMFMGY